MFSGKCTHSIMLGLIFLIASSLAGATQTLSEINKSNGFYEALVSIQRAMAKADDSLPKPLPEHFTDAWTIASEGAFDADAMFAAIEEQMAGKFSPAELSSLETFFSSPLGRRIVEMEIAVSLSEDSDADKAEGERILAELASSDPARLGVYESIMRDLNIVDNLEAMTLNIAYAMIAGMQGATGQSMSDEQLASVSKMLASNAREEIKRSAMAICAFSYRELSPDDLDAYAEFLATPAAGRYYDLTFHALGDIGGKEARSFAHKLFVALGQRKA